MPSDKPQAGLRRKLARVLILLVPSTLDLFLIATFVFWLALFAFAAYSKTWATPDLEAKLHQLPLLGSLAIVCVMALGELIGPVRFRSRAAGVISIIGCWGVYGVMQIPGLIERPAAVGFSRSSSSEESTHWILALQNFVDRLAQPLTACVVLIGGCVWTLAWIRGRARRKQSAYARWDAVDWLLDRGQQCIGWCTRNRLKVMLGLLAIALPGTVIRNALGSGGVAENGLLIFVAVVGGLLVSMIALAIVIQLRRRRWGRGVLAILHWPFAVGLFYVGAASWIAIRRETDPLYLAMLASVLPLSVALWQLIRKDHLGQIYRRSMWTFAFPILATLGTVSVWTSTDMAYFVVALPQLGVREALVEANASRSLQDATDGAVRLNLEEWGWTGFATANIRDASDLTVITKLANADRLPIQTLVIDGFSSEVDTRLIGVLGISSVQLQGQSISSEQLQDFAGAKTQVSLSGMTDFTHLSGVGELSSLVVQSEQRIRGLQQLFDHNVGKQTTYLYLDVPLTQADWETVIQVSRKCQVVIASPDNLPTQFWRNAPPNSLTNIVLYDALNIGKTKDFLRFADTGIQAFVERPPGIDPWDIAVAFPNYRSGIYGQLEFELRSAARLQSDLTFREQAQRLNWIYGVDAKDRITHIWLPSTDPITSHSAELQNVTTLRMDRLGLVGFAADPEVDVNALRALPKLERLYLPQDFMAEGLGFLKSLPNLKHLQITEGWTMQRGKTGFEACRNLESLRIFGMPGPETIAELQKLPKLKRLEIIAVANPYLPAGDFEAQLLSIRGALKNVEVEQVGESSVEPSISDKWKQHRSRIRDRLMKQVDPRVQP